MPLLEQRGRGDPGWVGVGGTASAGSFPPGPSSLGSSAAPGLPSSALSLDRSLTACDPRRMVVFKPAILC